MTLIVGIEQDGVAYVGADTGVWENNNVENLPDGKIIEAGPLLIGMAGHWRVANIVRYALDALPVLGSRAPEAYVVREFVPRMRAALTEAGAMEQGEDKSDKWSGNALIACSGQLFSLSDWFCVYRNSRGYATAGHQVAAAIAKGVFAATAIGTAPRDRLALALEAAEAHTDAVRGPYTFAEQRADKPNLSAVA